MATVLLIPILILVLAAIASYFVSKNVRNNLVNAGNKYSRAISSGVFILLFTIIACVLMFLFLSSAAFKH